MQPKIFAITLAVLIFISVIELIRRQKMTFKYALSWLAASGLVLFFAIQNSLLEKLSAWAGFELPSNFIFFLLLIFVILFSLLLTIYINEQNSRAESQAQTIARLDYRIKKLEKEITEK